MIALLDVNCRIGKGPADREGAPRGMAGLTALMDDFHVKKALVHHSVSVFSDPMAGNAVLSAETAGNGRFLRQWAVLPRLWQITPSPEALIAEMRENGVSAVRLFPAQYGHSLKRYAAGALLDALAAHRVPVFIGLEQLAGWDALYELCREYPDNRFVLCSPGYRCLRWLVPIMDACGNLWMETSNFVTHNGLREFCRYMGADRLLFGSGYPEQSVAAAASQLLLSDLNDAEKQKIGAGNAEALLGEVRL